MRTFATVAIALLLAPLARAAQPDDLEPAVRTSTAAAPTSTTPAPAAGAVTRPAPRPALRTAAGPGSAQPGAAAPATAPGAGAASAAGAAGGAHAKDRVELDTTQITGNRELPNVMYVVPWKKPELGEFSGRPPKSLLDELLAPVDREVFQRQNRYYTALRPDTAAGQRPGGSAGSASPQGDGKGEGVPAAPAGRIAADER